VAAAEVRHKPGRVRFPPQGQGGQLQARCPPLGAGGQRHDRCAGQVAAKGFTQQGPGLGRGEPQVGGAQLSQLPAGPQPRQRQQRVGPAGQHQPKAQRQVVKQEHQRRVHRRGVDQVVVVEDQQHLVPAGLGGQLVDQRRHQPFERGRCRRAQQRADPLADPRPDPVQRRNRVAPKPGRVVVGRIQRQPRHQRAAGPCPPGQQSGLTIPSRGADQDEPPRQPLLQRLLRAGAAHETRRRAGHVQLGGQQGILPGSGIPRRRLSHRRPTSRRVQRWPASLVGSFYRPAGGQAGMHMP